MEGFGCRAELMWALRLCRSAASSNYAGPRFRRLRDSFFKCTERSGSRSLAFGGRRQSSSNDVVVARRRSAGLPHPRYWVCVFMMRLEVHDGIEARRQHLA